MALSKCVECGKEVSTLAKTCPHCGAPKPTLKKKSKSNKNRSYNPKTGSFEGASTKKKKEQYYNPKTGSYEKETKIIKSSLKVDTKKVWAHCRDYTCRDYTQMFKVYQSYLDQQRCKNCGSMFMEPKMENGKPVMPKDGIYDKIQNKKSKLQYEDGGYTYSSTSKTSQNSSNEKDVFAKFFDGELDLATAFWGFGVFGSFIAGFILAYLAESFSKFLYIPYVGVTAAIIIALWECAENYKKEKLKKKESAVWGYLTQIFCGLGALGLVSTIVEIIQGL